MPTEMPGPVSRYFEHDARRDIDAIVALFADDATVIDEGETRTGIAEIRTWQLGPASAYTYRTELRDTEQLGANRYLATGRLTGNFPGSPVNLRFCFHLERGKIASLEIQP